MREVEQSMGGGVGSWERLVACRPLFSRVIHDFKGPLNLLRLIAQDIRIDHRRGRSDPGQLPGQMHEIEQAVDSMCAQIDQLSRLGSDDGSSIADTADLQSTCEAALVTAAIDRGTAEVSVELAADLVHMIVPRRALQSALVELLDNGRLAAQEAGRFVRITVSARADDLRVTLVVSDNGGGVAAADAKRIFDPFVSTRPGAAGLGLPLAAGVLNEVGGRVSLAASTGSGSTFEISLPRVEPTEKGRR